MYTGNKESLAHFYTDLKAKALLPLADESGLISTKTGKVSFNEKLLDKKRGIYFDGIGTDYASLHTNAEKYRQEGNFAVVEGVGSGNNLFELTR